MKRLFDIFLALVGLVLLWPLLLVLAALVKLDSHGPALFKHVRVGRGFRPFQVYKFRTMVEDAPHRGGLITFGGDPRITRVGAVLRRTKLDELPQLLNVLKGDMSLVGPRPEIPAYVERFRKEFEKILQARPGMTDFASLKYKNEEAELGMADNPEECYIRKILPEKIRLAEEYVARSSLILDCTVILRTIFSLFRLNASS